MFKVDEDGQVWAFGRVLPFTEVDHEEVLRIFEENSEPVAMHKRDGKWVNGSAPSRFPENLNG